MKILARFSLFAATLGILTGLIGCAVNPVTGQQQLMLLSEQDESTLGKQTDKSVIDQYGVYDDVGLQRYLEGMGQPMGRLSHRPALDWQFKVMDSPVVNAFAAPGGYIYVTRGLLAAVNDEAELAGVLGHEIGHVTARHSAQQYSKMMLANLGLSLGQGLLGSYGDVLSPVLEAGAGLLFLKFSRDDEREADALGVEYATRAGYDAGRMADFFITLQRQSSLEGQQEARLPEFFSTHPNPVNREANVRAMARNWQSRYPGQKFQVNRAAYLSRIDGMVYGDDPRKGFQENGWYYFPQYQAKLPIPTGWKLEREGNNLQMIHPEEKAVSLLSIRPDSNSADVVADFLKSTGAKVQDQRSSTSNGIPLRLILSTITSGQQQAVVISHFYQKGSDVFAFHGMTENANYATLKDVMQSPAKGFAVMTDRAKLNKQPQKIVIKSVARATILEKMLQSLKVDQSLWQKIAWLNGRELNEVLAGGERIKIIQ
ncbi:MAG: M48 family metalloprotease [Desulfuromonadales bacterium]|nr:M48 family metalloprotease [Desulfuromonadales bacterium]